MTDKSTANTGRWAGRNIDKDALRGKVWGLLEAREAAIGSPWSHIPNFVGAEEAAARLAQLPIWTNAQVVKSNPDEAQAPVRRRALEAGKLLYMPIPELKDGLPFVLLDPDDLQRRSVSFEDASHHTHAIHVGRKVRFEEMKPLDLIIVGCVAVTRNGGRTGKGAGFADLELGILREFGLVKPDTPIVTTVHPLQIVPDDQLVMQPHDSALHWIITPDEVIETHSPYPQPRGVAWDQVQPDQFRDIPFLARLRDQLSDSARNA